MSPVGLAREMAMTSNRDDEDGGGKGFLSRWSKRKRLAQEDDDGATEASVDSEIPISSDDPEIDELPELKANREAAEAVDLESLDYESDFSIFMKAGVPELLKRAAMRKLWTSNPLLANVDGLNDYDEDFADPKFNVFKSAWQAGRGYLRDEPEPGEPVMQAQAPADEVAQAETDEEITVSESLEDNVPGGADDASKEADAAVVDDAGETDETAAGTMDVSPRVSLRDRLKG